MENRFKREIKEKLISYSFIRGKDGAVFINGSPIRKVLFDRCTFNNNVVNTSGGDGDSAIKIIDSISFTGDVSFALENTGSKNSILDFNFDYTGSDNIKLLVRNPKVDKPILQGNISGNKDKFTVNDGGGSSYTIDNNGKLQTSP